MPRAIHESDVEENVLAILRTLAYEIIGGDNEDYLPGGRFALRADYEDIVLVERLRHALKKINPAISEEAREQAAKQVLRSESQKLIADNESFHKLLADGVDVPIQSEGEERYQKVWLFDFENPKNNDFLAINQFTVIENNVERRPDVILFVNGIPLLVIELKNPAEEDATIWTAYDQLQTYGDQLPSLFRFNEILVISDGIAARAGTITSERERFMQWKTIDGEKPRKELTEIEVLLRGICEKQRLLDIARNFIVFEKDKETKKKLAAYHQYWATNKAVESTIAARKGNKKAGIVWHTQGSGKSLTMIFYSGKLVRELDNPTIVVLTDRNDLDDQLFGTFGRCQDVLRQKPKQADSRKELRELLSVSSGGIVFTTIQKFFPEEDREKHPLLSERDNIVVIADEAHRSQYGFSAKILNKKDKSLITYGYAKYLRDALPNASFIGFTGTPIEKADRSTPRVFGKYVDTYDIQQAVDDGATVTIFYEGRLAKLELKPEERPRIDKEFEEVTEGEEVEGKEKLKSKWSRVEKVAGSTRRIGRIAQDIVNHFEERTSVLEGKGMIVCMSRRICVDLHNEIAKLRPEWIDDEDEKGFLKVVMTGSASDPKEWQAHIRNRLRRKRIGDNFKDPNHELKLLVVRDMFLTGFDAPSLHTMYLDKPIRGHTLMQAIARVNRVYPGKKGGLVVDYMGVGAELREALINYTASGGKGRPILDQEKAVMLMQEKYEIVKDMFHGFNYRKFFELEASARISFFPQAMEHILKEQGKKERFAREVTGLLRAFSLAMPNEKAMKIKEEVGLFQAIKSAITKTTETRRESEEKFDTAIKQILSKAVISDRIIDIFEAAGIQKPELSILSEGFLAEVKEMPQKNLAFEALKKLLNDEIRFISGKNTVQGKSFMEMLDRTIKKYTNKSVEAAQVIEELIELARKVREEKNRGKQQNMTDDELAFYDALGVNDSAVQVLGNETLRKIALELTQMIRNSVTIDWTQRESVQAEIRLKVRKILRRYGYPPDKQEKATQTVLEQAELIARDWTGGLEAAGIPPQPVMLEHGQNNYADARKHFEDCLQISRRRGDESGIASILHNLGIIEQRSGNYSEAVERYQESLEIKNRLDDQLGRASTLHQLANTNYLTGNYVEAQRLYNQSLEIATKLGDQAGIARTLHGLGVLAQRSDDFDRARKLYDQALGMFQELGDQSGISASLHQLAAIEQDRGNYVEAQRLYNQSLEIATKLGDQAGIASTLHNLATIEQSRGNYDEASKLYDKGLEIKRKLGDQSGISNAIHQLGIIELCRGEYDEAKRLLQESLSMYRGLGDQAGIAATLHELANIEYSKRNDDEASRLYEESLEIQQKFGNESGKANTIHQLGIIEQDRGNYDKAEMLFRESLAMKQNLGDESGIAATLHQMAIIQQDRGDYDQAKKLFFQSMETYRKLGDQARLALVLGQLGRLSERIGDFDAAEKNYQHALEIFQKIRSPNYARLSQQDLERVLKISRRAARPGQIVWPLKRTWESEKTHADVQGT